MLIDLSMMARALFFVIACCVSINAGDTSILNRLVRRAGSIVGSTLDRVEEVEKMNLTCFSTTDPHSVTVNHIFIGGCSTPASSRCVPCILDLNKTVLAVCKGISETVQLMMEADGQHIIDNIKTDCPSFAEPSDLKSQQASKLPGIENEVSTAGPFPWWGYVIITLGITMVFLIVLVYRKRQSIQKFVHCKFFTPETPAGDQDRPMDAVSEASPMNRVSVDKHQSLNEVDGTSTALM